MPLNRVVWDESTQTALVQPPDDAVPVGSVDAGTYSHPDGNDMLGYADGHVLYQHVQDLLYKLDVFDMQLVTIKVKSSLAVQSVAITPASATINKGATQQLTLVWTPTGATNKAASFATNAPAVATVSNTGLVSAVDGGDAVITVTTADGAKTATCAVKVNVPVDFISLDSTAGTLSLAGTKTHQITVFFGPANASNKKVTYVSSDITKATVSATGLVTGIAVGTASITVTADDGGSFDTFVATVTA